MLIYESGTVGTRPRVLPLSIGDGELAETATCVVSLPEIFAHYLQRGRVDVGFLGAAQIDRFGNLNSTVIGDYAQPARAPARRRRRAGNRRPCARSAGHHETVARAASCRDWIFAPRAGISAGSGARRASGFPGGGPRAVITDFGVLRPHPQTEELRAERAVSGRER